MDVSEIKDQDTLEAWLKARPRSDAAAVAQRSAMRTMPLICRSKGFQHNDHFALTLTIVQRCNLTALAAHNGKVGGSAAQAYWAALSANHYSDGSYSAGVEQGFGDSRAFHALLTAAIAAQINADDLKLSTFGGSYAKLASEGVNNFAQADDPGALAFLATYKVIRADATALESGTDPLTLPLWPPPPPDWFTEAESTMRDYWQTNSPEHWSFWQRWWDAAVAGQPLDWNLQRDIALIPDEIWQAGPGPVAEAIAKIEAEHALRRTFNGERIEQNPETGLFRLVPETDLPPDLATYAQRKMAKALAIFGDTPSNQYRPLEPALRVVREALQDRANLPVELFDACGSATRMVANMARTHTIPSPDQDACISEFVTMLRQAGADILSNDPKTQLVLTNRNQISGNTALIDNAEAIQTVAGQLANLSEGPLAIALPKDAALATNPETLPEDAKIGGFKLAGRIFGIAFWKVVDTAAVVTGIAKVIDAVKVLVGSPLFQQAWAAFLRWIGFG
jgi:hypothetical protein